MTKAQLLALKFELIHYLKLADQRGDGQKTAQLSRKLAAIDAQIKAAPPLGWRKAV